MIAPEPAAPAGGAPDGNPGAWSVVESASRVPLDGTGRGQLTFKVTNTGAVADRAVFDVVSEGGADRRWFSVDDPQRPLPPGQQADYLVRLALPTGAAPGAYTVRGRVYSADRPPEETSATSGPVAFEVAPPPAQTKRPWWLLAVGAAVALVLVIVVLLVLRDGEDVVETPTAPALIGLPRAEAERALTDAGLRTGQVRRRHDATATPSTVLEATVGGEALEDGETVPEGTTVDLVVAVNLTAPVPVGPPTGVHLTRGQQFDFAWQEVGDAAAYRFDVQEYQCQIPPDLSRPERIVEENGFIVEPRLTERLIELGRRFDCSFVPSFTEEAARSPVSGEAAGRLAPNFYQWTVTPLDDFGSPGPGSTPYSFQVEG